MTSNSLTRDQLRNMYELMAHLCACDEAVRSGIGRGKLMFFYFAFSGHEAIPVALSPLISERDYLITTYRGLHHQLAKGVPFEEILGEMTGKNTAISSGKSGAMHICDPKVGMMLTSGIVGGTLPPAVGMALASKVRGDGRVTICTFGDGAINTGSFHEAMNMAAVWQLPIVFICENNRFAESTPTHHTYKGTIVERAKSYGMEAETVDGYDPVAIFDALSVAVDRARSGKGPALVDAVCFRFFGHYFGDPMVTVPPEQLKAEMKKDPITCFTAKLIESGDFSEEELAQIRSEKESEAKRVVAENVSAPPVSIEGLFQDTYANPIVMR